MNTVRRVTLTLTYYNLSEATFISKFYDLECVKKFGLEISHVTDEFDAGVHKLTAVLRDVDSPPFAADVHGGDFDIKFGKDQQRRPSASAHYVYKKSHVE